MRAGRGGGPYDINRFFAVQNYKSTADRAQLIRCPSLFPRPFSEEILSCRGVSR